MRSRSIVTVAGMTVLLMALAATALAGGRPFTTGLSGASEVPGPGDPDGTGTAHLTLNQGQGEVCFDITVANIDAAIGGHIHVGTSDVAGPVVVNLLGTTPSVLSGCVEADKDLIKDIRQNPEDYYVNVHTAPFPAGAVRGQLSK